MKITIFKELTTEEHLQELNAESEKYTGLYVDMNNAPERKYVKEKADGINQLIKQVDRKRIDIVKEFKVSVEKEAADITERLEIANMPFTLLIDEHKAERKKILDAEKAEREAIELAVKIESDHEFALLMNDRFDAEKREAEAARIAYEEKLKTEAAAEATLLAENVAKENQERAERERKEFIQREEAAKAKAIADQEKAKQDAIYAEERRLQSIEDERLAGIERARLIQKAIEDEAARLAANKEHCGKVHRSILEVLITNGISEQDGKIMIKLIAKKQLPNVEIKY